MRRKIASVEPLIAGLRALRVLARIAPVDLAGFADHADLSVDDARALVRVFEETGFVGSMAGSALLIVTPLALTVLSGQTEPALRPRCARRDATVHPLSALH